MSRKYDGYVIGINLPKYIGEDGTLVPFKRAKIYNTKREAERVAAENEKRSGLECYVDPVKHGKVVPLAMR